MQTKNKIQNGLIKTLMLAVFSATVMFSLSGCEKVANSAKNTV